MRNNKKQAPRPLAVLGGLELSRLVPDSDMLLTLVINRVNLVDTLEMLDRHSMAFSPEVLSKILREIQRCGEAKLV